ncbi:MAG: molybdopterin-binding protein [Sphingomonas bacterium]|uniref:molybdopterin-dependent oxidoreductase n=1 Tax=Sphingomonas bacterium TaxID=1895847 RepID=UPI002634EAEB|nr:molybdopterin-dependent oxidoreductase [Sphingomonas bacterium]MDB5697112.1 molybdopterin-binding protein [Sphingomonas bacterium]
MILTRRALVAGGAATLLTGCERVQNWGPTRELLRSGEKLNGGLQRLLIDRNALAPEFRPDQMSPVFRVNGTANPNTPEYNALASGQFADWRLQIGGLVARPLRLSLAQLRSMPYRTQITRHDCVEGWSAIGQWQGPLLGQMLRLAGLRDAARFIVFHCADRIQGHRYYESIDLVDAFHPQTIMAVAMNGRPLDIGHGAPVRLRVERQLGYKHAKYVMGIEAVASLDATGLGKGGFWEDHHDYDWFAGI